MATSRIGRADDATTDGQPSPFTKVLVEGLLHGAHDSDNDGHVDLQDIYRYLLTNIGPQAKPRQKFDGFGELPIARRPRNEHPPAPTMVRTGSDMVEQPVPHLSFLDELTTGVEVSAKRIAVFREQLRPDIAAQMPELLSAREFLHRAHLMRSGQLTRAGALLFGEEPSLAVGTALVQCTHFDGTNKAALMEKLDLLGSLPEQIVEAYTFVAKFAKRGEAPTPDSVVSQPVYGYPMLAVREVIANALVHRDYENQQVCVHVRVFTDRIEIASPGNWISKQVSDGRMTQFGDLHSDSHRRNFTLAKVLAWMRLVEGEGAGIPRSIGDCQRLGAPEPTMVQDCGVVTVTIYPREQQQVSTPDPALREHNIKRLTAEIGALGVMADRSLREQVVAILPQEVRAAIPRHAFDQLDIASIVSTTCRFPRGLRELLEALTQVTGDTRDVRRIAELIEELGPTTNSSELSSLEPLTRLIEAAQVIAPRDPASRRQVIDFLRNRLDDFEPGLQATNSASDYSTIVRECVRLQQTELLAAAFRSVFGAVKAVTAFERLADELFGHTGITASERRSLDHLLRPLHGVLLDGLLASPSFSRYHQLLPPNAANAIEVCDALAQSTGAREPLLVLLELAAHSSSPDTSQDLHSMIATLAARFHVTGHLETHALLSAGQDLVRPPSGDTTPPLFFLSYASGEDRDIVQRFYQDLCSEVRTVSGLPHDAAVGFMDNRDVDAGSLWSNRRLDALATCRTFIALTSPRFFLSPACGKEWGVFASRLQNAAASQSTAPLMAIPWVPAKHLPLAISSESPPDGDPDFASAFNVGGVRQLIRLNRHRDEYQTFVFNLAMRIAQIASVAPPLPPARQVRDLTSVASAFHSQDTGPSSKQDTSPFTVHFVVVAGTRASMSTLRQPADYYGDAPRSWAPLGPTFPGTAAAAAVSIASAAGFKTTVSDLPELAARAQQAASNNQILVLLADPWAISLEGVADSLLRDWAGLTGQEMPVTALLMLSNPADSETATHWPTLAGRWQTVVGPLASDEVLFRKPASMAALAEDLPIVLEVARNRLFAIARLRRDPEEGSKTKRPTLWLGDPGPEGDE